MERRTLSRANPGLEAGGEERPSGAAGAEQLQGGGGRADGQDGGDGHGAVLRGPEELASGR